MEVPCRVPHRRGRPPAQDGTELLPGKWGSWFWRSMGRLPKCTASACPEPVAEGAGMSMLGAARLRLLRLKGFGYDLSPGFLGQNLDSPFRCFQLRMAGLGKLHPFLVELQGFFEWDVSVFQLLHNSIQALQVLLERLWLIGLPGLRHGRFLSQTHRVVPVVTFRGGAQA